MIEVSERCPECGGENIQTGIVKMKKKKNNKKTTKGEHHGKRN